MNDPDDKKNQSPKNEKSDLAKFADRYGTYIVGYLGALGALIFAYLMPASREKIISAAGSIAILTLLFSGGKQWVYRLIGMLGAGVCAAAAIFMPDQAATLLSSSGTIAVLTLLFF